MHPALYISVTGLDAKNVELRVISNNIANASTAAFKSDRAIFEDLLYQKVRQAGAISSENSELPSGLMLGTGVRTVASQKDFSQGSLVKSESPLDLAINGQGFFQVLGANGQIAYTRDGRFQINASGEIVTANGYPLQPGISIPPQSKNITIGRDGTVSVLVDGNVDPIQVGNITLANFINPAGLEALGENQFAQTASSGAPLIGTPGQNSIGNLEQSFYESSNVNVLEQLVKLIEAQRGYEINAKSIESIDGAFKYAVQVL